MQYLEEMIIFCYNAIMVSCKQTFLLGDRSKFKNIVIILSRHRPDDLPWVSF